MRIIEKKYILINLKLKKMLFKHTHMCVLWHNLELNDPKATDSN